jgi:hypothetical protein
MGHGIGFPFGMLLPLVCDDLQPEKHKEKNKIMVNNRIEYFFTFFILSNFGANIVLLTVNTFTFLKNVIYGILFE